MKIVEESLSKELKRRVYQGFSEHALASVNSDGDMEDITFVARNGEIVLGVVHAKTFWGALHIKYLYVVPESRGRMVGKLLMGKVLERGEEKGSRFAFVETMSFQALGFYKKMGFTEEFCRPGYDKDTSFYYLRKDF